MNERTGEQPVVVDQLAQVVRLPLLVDSNDTDATRFVHGRSLPPVPPARPRS